MKKNRNRGQHTRGRRPKTSTVEFASVTIQPRNDERSKAALLDTATRKVAEFPQMFELVREQFRVGCPLVIMAVFANALMRNVGRKGVRQNPSSNIQQYHGELLQAVLLTIPSDEWSTKPLESEPDVMQAVFDAVPKLSDTFFHERLLAAQKNTDEQKKAVMSLQSSIQLHTQAVRNWGYFGDVIEIVSELYGPLDELFSAHYGFGISDLAQVMKAIGGEYERRVNEGSRIAQANSPSSFMDHLNLEFPKHAIFMAEEVAALTGYAPELVGLVLREVSLPPGALVDAKLQHLFLSNPVWTAPGIDLGGSFFIPMPQITFSHIHSLVARLGAAVGLKVELEKTRSRFLESKLGEQLKIALPGTSIKSNVKWRSDSQGEIFETDYLAIIDRAVVIAEAKSNRLTPEGLRGAPDRMKRHIEELVLAPSIQSSRLEGQIIAAKGGDETAKAEVLKLGIEPSKVDRVIRLSVTLDDLSVLCSAEGQFKEIGWVPADHDLAPTLSIADFMCIVDILNNPISVLHYLSERSFFQKSFELFGDEIDFLGLYLETGFNLAALEQQNDPFAVTGLSGRIDRYYESRDAGVKLVKPAVKLRPLYRDIIQRLSQRRPEGWVTVGLHLLNSADYAEQQRVQTELAKLRRMVRRNFHDPMHKNSLQIQPLKGRKARLIFHLYPKELRATHKSVMERLALEALAQSQSDECCVIGKCIDNWHTPYETICVVRKRKPTADSA